MASIHKNRQTNAQNSGLVILTKTLPKDCEAPQTITFYTMNMCSTYKTKHKNKAGERLRWMQKQKIGVGEAGVY